MFGNRSEKGKDKKKSFWLAKAKKWKDKNILFTLIPLLIGKVSKRQYGNFEINKK